jgi:hypothetical protein
MAWQFSSWKVNPKLLLVTLIVTLGCKDPFSPDLPFKKSNFLVIEGYINVGVDAVTVIRLSRTVRVSEPQAGPLMEQDAIIVIEDALDNTYSLTELENGVYVSDTLTLPLDRQYRIRISTTGEEKEYVSEFTTPIQTPAIDSVSWARVARGVDINVATHDPENKTLYYQWDYEETWETKSPFFSFYGYNGDFYLRDEPEILAMKRCWKTAVPENLLVESLAKLHTNAVSKTLIAIPVAAERLSEKYSVVVRQHVLSLQAYNYMQIMSKNTNDLGTFYDPQPSQLIGNISVQNSNEPVIGYIGAYTTSEQRIYIHWLQVPGWGFNLLCEQVSVLMSNADSVQKYFVDHNYTPITEDETFQYMFATQPRCADCRLRGGNNEEPDYWDDAF